MTGFFWTIFLPLTALGAVGSLYLLFYIRKIPKLAPFKINQQTAPKNIMRKEKSLTMISVTIFSLVGLWLDQIIYAGKSMIYTDLTTQDIWYLPLSLAAAFLIHDTYFYWSHRLLHWGPVYRFAHNWHHRFHNPNPWTSFAFHPAEAFIQIGIIPLVGIILPVYSGVLIFFATFVLFMSVYGHLGFELRANKTRVFTLFNTSIHHDQHHKFFHCNYGIYFNFWDRIMGTNHETYPQAFIDFSKKIRLRKESPDSQENP